MKSKQRIKEQMNKYKIIKIQNDIKYSESLYFLSNVKKELEELKTVCQTFIEYKDAHNEKTMRFWFQHFNQTFYQSEYRENEDFQFLKLKIKLSLEIELNQESISIKQEILINEKRGNIITVKSLLKEINSLLKMDAIKNQRFYIPSNEQNLLKGKDFNTQRILNILIDKFQEGEITKEEFLEDKRKLREQYLINLEVDKFDELTSQERDFAIKSFNERDNQYLSNFLNYSQILEGTRGTF